MYFEASGRDGETGSLDDDQEVPEVRNEEGAHGQGATLRKTPNYVAAYALHLAAANILFLAETHKAMK